MSAFGAATPTEHDGAYSLALGRLRLALVYAIVLGLVAFGRPRILDAYAGLTIVATGEAIRIWSAGHLRKTVSLITSGPYRYCRNPLYLGRLLIFTGLCIMARLPWHLHWLVLAGGWAVFFGVYLPRKERVEPARLRARHGDAYERYRRAVPALLPRPTPWAEGSRQAWSLRRMFANREHWMVVGLVLVIAIFLWRAHSAGPVDADDGSAAPVVPGSRFENR